MISLCGKILLVFSHNPLIGPYWPQSYREALVEIQPLQIHLQIHILPYKSTYIYHTHGGKHTSPMDVICLGWWIHYESTYNFFSWLVLTGKDGWRSIGFLDSTWVLNRTCCQKRQSFLFFVFEVWKGFVWYCWWFRNLVITSWYYCR